MSKPLDSPQARVLIVDDDPDQAAELADRLERSGCAVESCGGGARLERLVRAERFDAVLSDQDTAPLERFQPLLESPDPPALILLAGFGSIHDAVQAVRAGAADYLSRPVSDEQLSIALRRALEERRLRTENARLRADLGERFQLGSILSRAPAMMRVFETIQAVADTRATILIEGESGTGKTMLARAVHQHSSRAERPFVEVNCGALPDSLLESELFGHVRGAFTGAVRDKPGKFEAAEGGTIFLDEIACASLDLQVKLLRVLQDRVFERVGDTTTRQADVRIIAAANVDLAEEVREQRFRQDLFYRLKVVSLEVPPLRERRGDVPLLAEYFLNKFRREYARGVTGFSPAALAAITAHDWPGNVRELEHCLERSVLLAAGDRIEARDLPPELAAGAGSDGSAAISPDRPPLDALPGIRPLKDALEHSERELILSALRATAGSRKETADRLGVNRTTLFNKMKKYNLMDLEFDGEPAADDESGPESPFPRSCG
ncbi:MAG: sigma-54-dependent Fis family transcriptional regulator [Planctomycetes bacterium]|nr:sigma-54-dependent Fis family transcriptional regulator [Planctomycetota bacterium]MCB9904129.1 sigma-54-dependent Fis family transcriptional regulator [Planctomycetota bacterium]